MAFTTTIRVIPHLSPRIIKILAPITVMSVQELTNQIKDWEDEPSNLSYPVLVNTSGKESLGGGVSVGITAELQNAKVMFEARTESDQIGTYTGSDYPDPSNTILTDDNALFSYTTNPGDTIINMMTGAAATIISVDSPTQVTHEPLDDGVINFWEYGDDYKIWNKVQCEINGGNLVAVDEAGDELSPFLPSAFTHVIRTSASSATLQEQEDIQFSAFSGGIWINAASGTSGTTFPAGTPRQPVDNLADAITISSIRGLDTLFFIGDYTFVSGDNVSLKQIRGESISKSTLTFESGAISAGTEFFDATIQGILISPSGFVDCQLLNITGDTMGITGTIVVKDCTFGGTITLSSALIGDIQLLDCKSGISGADAPVFNANGAQVDVLVRNYAGGMEIRGITYQYSDFSIDMISGTVILDSSNTTGSMQIRGIANLVDDSGDGMIVDTTGLIFANEIQLTSFEGRVSLDVVNGIAGTEFPIGTHSSPVNNLTDAQTILLNRGLDEIILTGTLIVFPGETINNLKITGNNPGSSIVVLSSGCVTIGTVFENVTLTGVADGNIICSQSRIFNLSGIGSDILGSVFTECQFLSTVPIAITMKAGLSAPKTIQFLECYSGTIGHGGIIFDMNSSSCPIAVLGWKGSIIFDNWTGAQSGSIEMYSGHITVNASCTYGTLMAHGVSMFDDNSTGAFLFDTAGIVNEDTIADQVWEENIDDHDSTLKSFGKKLIDILKLKRTKP